MERQRAKENYPTTAQRLYGHMEGRVSLLARGAIKRAKEKGVPFDTDLVEKLIARNATHCECCNVEYDFTMGKGMNNRARSISLDRTKAELGYTDRNVRLVCWRCNDLMSDGTSVELRRVADFRARCEQELDQRSRYTAEATERPSLPDVWQISSFGPITS